MKGAEWLWDPVQLAFDRKSNALATRRSKNRQERRNEQEPGGQLIASIFGAVTSKRAFGCGQMVIGDSLIIIA